MSDVNDLRRIREWVAERYRRNPRIRVNVSLAHPRLQLCNVEAEITGVYSHLFQVEETMGEKKRHTLQYTDVLLHNIELLDP